MSKMPIPEYQSRLLSNGLVSFQFRVEYDGSVYKREYPHVFGLLHDLADKFGAKFANKVIKDLGQSGRSTNRVSNDAVLDAQDMQQEIDLARGIIA